MQIEYPFEIKEQISTGCVIPLRLAEYSRNHCHNCGGVGYVFAYEKKGGPFGSPAGEGSKWLTLPGGTGWYSGKTLQVDCPVCSNGGLQDWLRRNCGMDGIDLDISLSGFSVVGKLSSKAPAKSAAGALLAQNRQASGFLTFWGSYGVGKTHLLKAITNGFRMIGLRSFYTTMADLLSDIRVKFGDVHSQREVQEAVESYRSIRVLCVDEIDRVNLTNWVKETAFTLIDSRYTQRTELVTVVASNLSPLQFPEELGYLASRINGGTCVEVTGGDMRPAVRISQEEK